MSAGPEPPQRAEPDGNAAFRAFYEQERPGLVAFLMAMGVSFHDANDIAQEAMKRAYLNWATIAAPRAWIRTVASRIYFRKVLASQEDPVDEIPEKPAFNDAALAVMFGEEQSRVLRLLSELSPRQRQVMAWCYDGYAPREIAEHLDMEANTVRVTLHNARQALKERLQGKGDSQDERSHER